jgi:hypothetical protein
MVEPQQGQQGDGMQQKDDGGPGGTGGRNGQAGDDVLSAATGSNFTEKYGKNFIRYR